MRRAIIRVRFNNYRDENINETIKLNISRYLVVTKMLTIVSKQKTYN